MGSRPSTVVSIWNELTPYRLHVMRRVAAELPHVRAVNVFTHSFLSNSSPWQMDVTPDLNVFHDEANRIPKIDQFVHARALRLARSIFEVIQRERPVFVVLHGHKDVTRLSLLRRLKRLGIPVAHASDANVFSERVVSSWRHPLRSASVSARMRVLAAMDAYMPMGIAGRAYYKLYGRPGVPFFPFPYEPDYALISRRDPVTEQQLREEHRLPDSRKRFLYSGRLVPGKGLEGLIEAFSMVAESCPDWDLVLAGDGPIRASLERAVPERLRSRVTFLGFMQMDRLRSAYHVCHALVHPSERDQWALVVNEAMAASLPLVVTDVTGAASDLVRNRVNGYIIRPGRTTDLADALRYCAQPSMAERMGENSRKLLEEWRIAADPVAGFDAAVRHFSGSSGG
jgi:glycosyltransferase involved in cell wall biosynthesis